MTVVQGNTRTVRGLSENLLLRLNLHLKSTKTFVTQNDTNYREIIHHHFN